MANNTDIPAEAHPEFREYCYACRRAKKNCLCDSIKPFATKMRFVILMHEKEARQQKTGTARLAHLCLSNSELFVGVDFTQDERVNALLRDPSYVPFVLYPGPKAVNFETLGRDLLPAGKNILIFVIDGTWNCARRIMFRSRNVGGLPRISFSRSYLSRFAIKRQPMPHCVSTIEALYHLCSEAGAAGYEDLGGRSAVLPALLDKLVAVHMPYKNGNGRRREENKRKKVL